MLAFQAPTSPARLDQADGLRRMFGDRRQTAVPVVSNPFVAFQGCVIERLSTAAATLGRHALVVDAAEQAPPAHELARLELASCIDTLTPDLSYLAARGLPMRFVDTRGRAGSFLDALTDAAPQAEFALVHAPAPELARVFAGRAARPVVVAADHPEGLKHAYAGIKLLAQRAGLMTFDLLVVAHEASPRVEAIASTLGGCAERFLGVLLHEWALVDPVEDVMAPVDDALLDMVQAQWELQPGLQPAAALLAC